MVDYSRKWWALAAVGSGTFMATIDGSIVNIALKTIQDSFKAEFHSVEWVVLCYLLTIACLLPTMGRLGDMFGKRRIALGGFAIFTIGSALCGLAWNIQTLIAARVLQGVGAAMLQGVSSALLVMAFPASERGQALGYIGSIVAAGILAGPVLGGILLRYTTWPVIFLVNVPIGLAAIALTLRALPDDQTRSTQRFDIGGAIILAGALLMLLYALTEGQAWGIGDWRTITLIIGGIIGLIGFVFWEQRAPAPMIDLSLFRNPSFSLSLVASFASFVALSFNFLLMPYYLQEVLGYDPQRTGLTLIASPIVLALISPVSGRLSDRFGARWLGVIGLAISASGLLSMATLTQQSSQFDIILRLMWLGLGIGLFQSPNNSMTMGSVPRTALGIAGSLLAVMRTLGQTTGIAIAGAVWAVLVTSAAGRTFTPITSAPPDALVYGIHGAMMLAALLAALGILPALARPVTPSAGPQTARPA
ncbi:MAG: MFS transporter [Roseiflexaceae bacterium]|nr:MFS transporter [Roseiflexaceae bacterium]